MDIALTKFLYYLVSTSSEINDYYCVKFVQKYLKLKKV